MSNTQEDILTDGIGLALGSGAALGAAHVGVLKAIEELDIQIDYVAGTSIGAVIGAFYAFGMPIDRIEDIALDLNWPDVSGITLPKLGLFSNHGLGEFLNRQLGDVQFRDSEKPLAVLATNITDGTKVILNEGDVSSAVKASACVPVLYEPVEIDGQLLVDGGLMESIPLSALKKMGASRTIGVDLKSERQYQRPRNILDILNNSFEIALKHLANVNVTDIDVLIQPKLGEFSRTDTTNSEKMIRRGYEAASHSIQEAKLLNNK